MSFSHHLFVVCFFLAWHSCAARGRAYREEDAYRHLIPGMATSEDAQLSLKQKILELFFAQLLQKEILASAEQQKTAAMLNQDVAEEETDQLTSITRYVGIGYNLLKGSPDGDFILGGADPGVLTTKMVFAFTYQENKESYFSDKVVQVPDQVNFQPLVSCSSRNKASVYSGEKSYQKSLNYGIDAKATVSGFQFGLSGAIKKADEETAGRKQVYQDQKRICNYGRVEYLTDSRGIHAVSKPFFDRVKSLPVNYNVKDYMQFIEDWGTHMIVRADIGTKNITRSSLTYTGVYQQLKKQKSGGFTFGGNLNGQGGSLGLDASKIDTSRNNHSKFSSQISAFNIGTRKNPFPIHLRLWNISEVLRPEYWTTLPEAGVTHESLGISQKKKNLERALADYADYKGVDELKDPSIMIDYKWPNGEYALPAPEGDCPKGWSRGHRTQGTGSNVDLSSGITSRLGVKFEFTTGTITLHYCIKDKVESDGGAGFEWPEGSYCIAQKGGYCPEDAFRKGNISWNDYKAQFLRTSYNDRWGTLPDGKYDKNTVIFFCCRNDNRASSPMMLPIAEPFVLYRYGGECQAVAGTTVQEDFIKYDDTSRVRSKNKCTGAHPDDDDCGGEHRIHFCYYRRK